LQLHIDKHRKPSLAATGSSSNINKTVKSFGALKQLDGGDRVVQGLKLFHKACQTSIDAQDELDAFTKHLCNDIAHAEDKVCAGLSEIPNSFRNSHSH